MKPMVEFLSPVHKLRSVKRRLVSCCLLTFLCVLLVCGVLFGLSFYLARQASAQGADSKPQQVMLIIDNSQSMYDKGGLGSDPDFLRIEAARLFITYLGVDSSGPAHRAGVIFFGTEAELAIPLTLLTDDNRRAEMVELIANPVGMGWTNPQTALDLAEQTLLAAKPSDAAGAIVLLTDGKPEWSKTSGAQEVKETNALLLETAERLANQNIPLYIILLQNAATDADPEIEDIYVPLWQTMAQATPGGQFYRVRQSQDLLGIYHSIALSLTGRQTAGIVVQTQVQTRTVKVLPVEPGLAQVTFVVRKSNPILHVTVYRPNGRTLSPSDSGVQHASRPGKSLEEIWVVNNPPDGKWQVEISGEGTVMVWKDFYPATPTPTFTPSPTATPSPVPTRTPTATPTVTPQPTPTLTASPTSTPGPTATPLPGATFTPHARPSLPSTGYIWWISLPLIALVAVGGGWMWLRQKQMTPLLEGTLRRLSAPTAVAQKVPARFELDMLSCKEMVLGPDPKAEFHLPQVQGAPTPTVRLIAQPEEGGQIEILLRVNREQEAGGAVQVNDIPVVSQWVLRDGDVIELGAYKFRYENLRQRRPRWSTRL